MPVRVQQLTPADVASMKALLALFADAFGDEDAYLSSQPSVSYLRKLLSGDSFIALVALNGDEVVGGIAAYELRKFEQERSEVYIYDLAVAVTHRRQGIATALIRELGRISAARGAYVMLVQADAGDDAAIALYSKLGRREEVLHFDIAVEGGSGGA